MRYLLSFFAILSGVLAQAEPFAISQYSHEKAKADWESHDAAPADPKDFLQGAHAAFYAGRIFDANKKEGEKNHLAGWLTTDGFKFGFTPLVSKNEDDHKVFDFKYYFIGNGSPPKEPFENVASEKEGALEEDFEKAFVKWGLKKKGEHYVGRVLQKGKGDRYGVFFKKVSVKNNVELLQTIFDEPFERKNPSIDDFFGKERVFIRLFRCFNEVYKDGLKPILGALAGLKEKGNETRVFALVDPKVPEIHYRRLFFGGIDALTKYINGIAWLGKVSLSQLDDEMLFSSYEDGEVTLELRRYDNGPAGNLDIFRRQYRDKNKSPWLCENVNPKASIPASETEWFIEIPRRNTFNPYGGHAPFSRRVNPY